MSKTTKSIAPRRWRRAQVETALTAVQHRVAWQKSADAPRRRLSADRPGPEGARRGRRRARPSRVRSWRPRTPSSVSKTIAGVVAVFEDLAGYATETQKQAADFAASQNSTAYAAAQQQFEAASAKTAETFQRGLDTLLEIAGARPRQPGSRVARLRYTTSPRRRCRAPASGIAPSRIPTLAA